MQYRKPERGHWNLGIEELEPKHWYTPVQLERRERKHPCQLRRTKLELEHMKLELEHDRRTLPMKKRRLKLFVNCRIQTHELTGTVEHGKRKEAGTKLEHGKIV